MKLKRLFTAVLSAALTLSLCAMPAMAADDTPATTPKTSTSTIDKGQLGSITIHKYLMDDTSKALPSTNGEKTNTLPDGALPASGVEFTLYQVKDIDELIQYFDGVSNAPEVDAKSYFNNKSYNDGVTAAIAGKPTVHGETNKDGIVTFENLELGLYLVVESKKPVTVTEAVEPFLVSVPMTRIGKDGKTIPNEWLYDIHVYPKNSTRKGDVTLKKMGAVGDKTDPNSVPVQGVKFTLEMLTAGADANDEASWNLIPFNDTTNEFTTNDKGEIKAKNLIPGKYRFTEVDYAQDAPNKSYIINNGDKYVFEVDGNGTVQEPVDAKNTADYDAADKTITVYNYRPDVNKLVKNRSNGYGDAADYNKDDTITYKVVVDVPTNIEKLRKFVLTDTPTHLTDNFESVKVYSDETMQSEVAPGNIYSVAKTEKGFTITFTPEQMGAFAGEKLYVSYTAQLDKDENGNFTGSTTVDGNSNSIVLTYSNKTNLKQEEAEESNNQTKIKDEAVVYSFQLNVQKTDGTNKPLGAGVMFDLYKESVADADGALTPDEAKKLGFEKKDKTGYVLVQKNLVTDDKGQIVYKGLANGNYWLVETKTLEGYNLLAKPVEVTLNINYKESLTENKTYVNGVLVKSDVSATQESFSGTSSITDKEDGKTIGGSAVTVVNRKGFTLPVTGGFSTLLFSGIGVLLVLAGVGVLFSLKKKSNRA